MIDEILIAKRREVEEAKERLPLEELMRRVSGHLAERSLRRAITQPGKLCLIAELKRKSPSRGMLRERFDPVSLAQQLEEAGASALSVLTDEHFFGGHLDFLKDVKSFVDVPVLRKDFIIDPYQVYEAAWYQADAVLLIVGALTEEALQSCLVAADTLGMDALVEVHHEDELKTALGLGAGLLGLNHRDLKTFRLQPDVAARLVPKIPQGKCVVAESGIQTTQDLQRLRALGVQAVLIGEALMVAPDPAAKVHELFDGLWSSCP